MKAFDDIFIDNFKSVRNVLLTNVKRINLFIGPPNSGKSNIIEALSLLTIPYLPETSSYKLSSVIRFSNKEELFYSHNDIGDLLVAPKNYFVTLYYRPVGGLKVKYNFNDTDEYLYYDIDDNTAVKGSGRFKSKNLHVKKYIFKSDTAFKSSNADYLIPPYGANLLNIIHQNEGLQKEVIRLFQKHNLKFDDTRKHLIAKVIDFPNIERESEFSYYLLSETLQRFIFLNAAIASNNKSILLFDEPDCPPLLTRQIARAMIRKRNNQYFLTSNSPYMLADLLKYAPEQLAVFIVYFQNNETRIKKVTDSKLNKLRQSNKDAINKFFFRSVS